MTFARSCLAAALLAFTTSAAAAITPADVVRQAVDGYIRPGYQRFDKAAEGMAEAQKALCASPSEANLAAARRSFADVVMTFSQVEFVRFGPAMADNRVDRILFWPDPRGIALRQVQGLLAGKDETATDPVALHGKSVAVQGLTALEFVLYGTDAQSLAGAEGDYRCRYGAAIAANVLGMADAIVKGWQEGKIGFAEDMLTPKPTNPAYRSITDSLQQITGVFIQGFELMRDLRLRPAFGRLPGDAKPKALLFWRSGLTATSLSGNFSGLSELFESSDLDELLPPAAAASAVSVRSTLNDAAATLATMKMPIDKALVDPVERTEVGRLLVATQTLQPIFVNEIAPALGLSTGFSSLDGD
ncbi:peptidase M75 [Aureimonas sp. SA4125]|uniref:imelysin family protein n=1 Tax=Aureimonas sp. SA4125 TaxID=2826993 RepID=UPI001CC61311|nr:imelysin family protein [Aureimonas sp. SA4125]BDA86032.1 peptidase M75 [Aureimonas sp. SA4125]